MDWLTFSIRLVEALAWPGAAVVIVLTFRKQFQALLPNVRKLKAGPVEAEFERDIQDIAQEVSNKPSRKIQPQQGPRLQLLLDLAGVHPRSAIMESWLGVESAVRKAALQRIATSPPPDVKSPLQAIRALVENDEINSEDAALFQDLRGWRNQAAHFDDFNPSYDAVEKYVRLANELQARLEGLAVLD